MRLLVAVLIAMPLALAGCVSDTQVSLAYPQQPGLAGQGAVAVAVHSRVIMQRQAGREDPTWIGAVRGGYGNPVLRFHTPAPVDRVIADAFAAGLAARGMGAPAGGDARYVLEVTVYQFDANRYMRQEATADFGIVVTDRQTGQEVWRDRQRVYNVTGSLLPMDGLSTIIEAVRSVAERTMNEAIDTLLDRPGFRAALQRA